MITRNHFGHHNSHNILKHTELLYAPTLTGLPQDLTSSWVIGARLKDHSNITLCCLKSTLWDSMASFE